MKTTATKIIVNALVISSFIGTAQLARSADSARKPIAPSSHALGKAVVQVSQIGADPLTVGNGFVAGVDGCHVVTNFHVAFGKGKDSSGKVTMVENIDVGHVVEVGVDLNPKTGQMTRKIKARVVEFGDYVANDSRGLREDLAMLKLDECLGREYGVARFETPKEGVHTPGEAILSTLSLSKSKDGKSALLMESQCVAANDTPVAGLFFSNCETVPGMSGSPVLRADADGGFTIVGMTTGTLTPAGKAELKYAIFSSALTPFVQGVLGSEPIRLTDLAGAPANPLVQTASKTSGRTVVR